MLRKFLLTISLLIISTVTYSQNLNNDQLIKLYGFLVDVLSEPRNQMLNNARIPSNRFLESIDPAWGKLMEDDIFPQDSEIDLSWNYTVNHSTIAMLHSYLKVIGKIVQPSVALYTPYSTTYTASQLQISKLGKFISQSKNKYGGVEKSYFLEGLTFIYSIYPAHTGGFSIDGKLVTLYCITIIKDL